MSCLIVMSQKELHRLEHIRQVRQGGLKVTTAAELLGLSRSQVHRLLQAYDLNGIDGLVSKKRGRPSNRRYSEDFRNLALDLVREHYVDFGPTLAAEKLAERDGLRVSRETLLAMDDGGRNLVVAQAAADGSSAEIAARGLWRAGAD